MATQVFQGLAAQWDATLATGVNTVIANGLTSNAAALTDAMVLYYLILGGMMTFREVDYRTFVTYAMRGAMVSAILVAATYQQLIAVPLMQTIPNWIAQATSNTPGVAAGPQQFDLLWSAVQHQEAAILQQATGLENLAYRLEAAAVAGTIGTVLIVAFIIWEFSRAIMGLLVATAPFLIFMALFSVTRPVLMRLIDKAIGSLILQLMLSILLAIMLAADSQIMVQQANAGLAGAGLDDLIANLWSTLLMFLFGLGMLVFIPSIAAYIGGGTALNIIGSIGGMASAGLTAARGGIGAAGRGGSWAANRARAKLQS